MCAAAAHLPDPAALCRCGERWGMEWIRCGIVTDVTTAWFPLLFRGTAAALAGLALLVFANQAAFGLGWMGGMGFRGGSQYPPAWSGGGWAEQVGWQTAPGSLAGLGANPTTEELVILPKSPAWLARFGFARLDRPF